MRKAMLAAVLIAAGVSAHVPAASACPGDVGINAGPLIAFVSGSSNCGTGDGQGLGAGCGYDALNVYLGGGSFTVDAIGAAITVTCTVGPFTYSATGAGPFFAAVLPLQSLSLPGGGPVCVSAEGLGQTVPVTCA